MNIGETSERATYIGKGRKPNRGGRTQRQDRPANNAGTGILPQLQGKCFRCGKDGHSKDCRLSKTIECNACKKQGHLKVAFMTELRKQGTSKPREQKARAMQEESDSSTGEDDNFEKVNYVSHARHRGTEAPSSTCD